MFNKSFSIKVPLLCLFAGIATLAITQTTSTHALMNVCTWTGTTNQNFNTATNWSGCNSTVPQTGDSLTFPIGITNEVLNNDMPAGSSFTVFRFNTDGYVINGNAMVQTDGITGPNSTTGASSYTINAPLTLQAPDMTNTMLAGKTATFNGKVTLTGMNYLRFKGGGKINFAGGLTGNGGAMNDPTDSTADTTEIKISGAINDFTGSVNVNGGRTFVCASPTCFGQSTNNVNIIGHNAITFDTTGTISNKVYTAGTGGNSMINFLQNTTLSGDISLGNSTEMNVNSTYATAVNISSKLLSSSAGNQSVFTSSTNPSVATFTFTGSIDASSNVDLYAKLNSKLILNNTNLGGGIEAITDSSATLTIQKLAALSTAMNSSLYIGANGLVTFDLPANSIIAAPVNFATNASVATTTDITLNNYTFAGGSLTKSGAGTLIFGGTGTTVPSSVTVASGPISFNNNAFASTPITIPSGVTLKGTGKVGAVTVTGSGSVNPGNSPGCLTVASIQYSSASNEIAEIAGNTVCTQYDQLVVTGSANLGNATLTLSPSYTPTTGQTFTILTAGTLSGTYNGLAEGNTVTANGLKFTISYLSNKVTLTYQGGTLLAATGVNTTTTTILVIIVSALALTIALLRTRTNKR